MRPCATPRIGAEVEFLVRERTTGAIAQLDGSLGAWLREIAASDGWSTEQSSKGAPKYRAEEFVVTLEPGGQLEFSTIPCTSARTLVDLIQRTAYRLADSAANHGLELHSFGIDPLHSLAETPLQLNSDRYGRMDTYFAATGTDAGRRMMRQTAAVQISVDAAHDPDLTWRVLNRAAPVFTALFANSRMYAGRDTGYASFRAATWASLDPTRTGVIPEAADVTSHKESSYSRFALRARCIEDTPQYRAFEDVPDATPAGWDVHLSTLFPDVRPRGFYEIRCIDAIPAAFIAAPIVLAAAIAFDERALRASYDALPRADNVWMARAAREGLNDADISAHADSLVSIVVGACGRLGPSCCSDEDIAVLRGWLQSRRDVRLSNTTSSATII
jgi:glutamate--cysteine ligase